MAMNLRLSEGGASALRTEAERTGRRSNPAWQAHKLRPPRVEYRKATPALRISEGVSSLDLLGRDDRV